MIENPVNYYEDGRPYLFVNGEEITNHPAVACLVRLNKIEEILLPSLKKELDSANSYKNALINDIPQLGACITCKHWKSKKFRKSLRWYCDNAEELGKGVLCDMNDHWEWRGPQK